PEQVVKVVGVQGQLVVGIHFISDVGLGRGGPGALADLNVQGAVHLVVAVAVHGEVKGQGVLVGRPVGAERQAVQLELVVVPNIILVIIEAGVIQVAVV